MVKLFNSLIPERVYGSRMKIYRDDYVFGPSHKINEGDKVLVPPVVETRHGTINISAGRDVAEVRILYDTQEFGKV